MPVNTRSCARSESTAAQETEATFPWCGAALLGANARTISAQKTGGCGAAGALGARWAARPGRGGRHLSRCRHRRPRCRRAGAVWPDLPPLQGPRCDRGKGEEAGKADVLKNNPGTEAAATRLWTHPSLSSFTKFKRGVGSASRAQPAAPMTPVCSTAALTNQAPCL